jgi:hypothetical protein
MTAPDHMSETFKNCLHETGHPHMGPPANPARFSFDRHEAHVRSHHGLADCCRIRRVILAAPDIRFHVGRRHNLHLMPPKNEPCRKLPFR